jgi:hypothetical protein
MNPLDRGVVRAVSISECVVDNMNLMVEYLAVIVENDPFQRVANRLADIVHIGPFGTLREVDVYSDASIAR